jgi:uncharacterized protein (DUF1501 family)
MKKTNERSRRSFLQVSSALGLAAAFSPVKIGDAFAASRTTTMRKEEIMAQSGAIHAADTNAIRPFHVNVPETELPNCADA